MAETSLTNAAPTPATAGTRSNAKPAQQDKSQAGIMLERMTLLRTELKYAAELTEQVLAEVSGEEKKQQPLRETPQVVNVEGFFPAAEHLMGQMEELATRLGNSARALKSRF